MEQKMKTEIEALTFQTLVHFLQQRTDIQNIDMMHNAGFCRNCLSSWAQQAAEQVGVSLTKAEAQMMIYGMPYEQWKNEHQTESKLATSTSTSS